MALVRTADLFPCVRYLRSRPDPDYAKACRQRIFDTDGEIVVFPAPQLSTPTSLRETGIEEISTAYVDELLDPAVRTDTDEPR